MYEETIYAKLKHLQNRQSSWHTLVGAPHSHSLAVGEREFHLA